MTAYIIILLLIIFGEIAIYNEKKINDSETLYLVYSGAIFSFFSAFRSPMVGTDTQQYINIFNHAGKQTIERILFGHQGVDRGYLLINKFFYNINSHDQFILILSAIFVNFGIMYFIKKRSSNPPFSVYLYMTLYFFATSLNIMRQFIVIAIFAFAIEALKKNKNVIYILLIIFASTIHSTAILLLPFIFLYKIKPSSKNMIIISIASIIFTLVFLRNPSAILSLFGQFNVYQGTNFLEARQIGPSVIIQIFKLILFLFSTYLLRNKNDYFFSEERRDLFVDSIMVFLGVIFYIIGLKISILIRITYYFDIFLIFLIPTLIKVSIKEKRLAKIIIYSLMFVYYIYMLQSGGGGVVPYEFV